MENSKILWHSGGVGRPVALRNSGVCRRLYLAMDGGCLRRFKHPLGQDDDRQIVTGIDKPGRSQAAGASEGAVLGDGLAVAPGLSDEEVGTQATFGLLFGVS